MSEPAARPLGKEQAEPGRRPAAEDPAAVVRDLAANAARPWPPARLGRYEVLGVLGKGGAGVVLRARDPALAREVAIKVLRGPEATERQRERFLREGLAAASLQHPHIVRVHELGRDPEGCPYLVMDCIPGDSLRARVRREGPLEPARAARVCEQLARALACAHAAGVLHRDVKPANALLDGEGRALLSDFGLARTVGGAGKLTATGTIVGTPAYMPPEQVAGDFSRLDARSDVYSLGATLYELLVGRPPFEGRTMVAVLQRVLHARPIPPRELHRGVDRDLQAICLRCLAKRPEERYPSAEALAADLRRFLGGAAVEARARGGLEEALRRLARPPLLAGALALALGAGALVLLARPPGPTVEERRAAAEGRTRELAAQLLRRGRRLVEEGQPAAGAAALSEALALEPRLAEAHNARGVARLALGQTEAAREDFLAELARLPSHAPAHQNLAWAAQRLGDGELAATHARRAVALDPRLGRAWLLLGLSLAQPASRAEALRCLDRAAALRPADPEVFRARARLHRGAGRLESAGRDLERAVALAPRSASARVDLGEWALTRQAWERARDEFTQALALAPDDPRALEGRAAALVSLGRLRAAISDAGRALERSPSSTKAARLRGVARYRLGRLQPALEDFGRVLADRPTDLSARTNRALIHLQRDDLALARTDLEEALRLAPQHPDVLYVRAGFYMQTGRWGPAFADLSQVLERRPRHVRARCYRAMIYRSRRQLEEARRELDLCLELAPSYASAYRERAVVREAQGDPDGARRDRLAAEALQREGRDSAGLGGYEDLDPASGGGLTPAPSAGGSRAGGAR